MKKIMHNIPGYLLEEKTVTSNPAKYKLKRGKIFLNSA